MANPQRLLSPLSPNPAILRSLYIRDISTQVPTHLPAILLPSGLKKQTYLWKAPTRPPSQFLASTQAESRKAVVGRLEPGEGEGRDQDGNRE